MPTPAAQSVPAHISLRSGRSYDTHPLIRHLRLPTQAEQQIVTDLARHLDHTAPIYVDAQRRIVAGVERLQAYEDAGLDPEQHFVVVGDDQPLLRILHEYLAGLILTTEERVMIGLRLLDEIEEDSRRRMRHEPPRANLPEGLVGRTSEIIATLVGLGGRKGSGERTMRKGIEIAKRAPELVEHLPVLGLESARRLSTQPEDVRRLAIEAVTAGRDSFAVVHDAIAAANPPRSVDLDGMVDIFYGDPPYAYARGGARPSLAAAAHYRTEEIEAIIEIFREALKYLRPRGLVCLWSPSSAPDLAFRIFVACRLKCIGAWYWRKLSLRGKPVGNPTQFGQATVEPLYIACREGETPLQGLYEEMPRDALIAAERPVGHSRKPDIFAEMIVRAWPNARRLELFARKPHPGFEAWGNQVEPEPPPQPEPQPKLPRAIAVRARTDLVPVALPIADIRNRLFVQSCESMWQIPDRSIQLALTSPPYFGQIDYGCEGQIGLEDDPREYIARLVRVFRELHRVVMDDGSAFVIVDDTYHGDSQPRRSSGETRAKVWDPSLSRGNGGTRRSAARIGTWRPRTLIGIPGMIEEALRETDWIVRDRIIWAKPHARTNPRISNRCTPAYEFILYASKSERYYADADELRKHTNVWTIPVGGSRLHPATFPEALAERCIQIGSRPGDIVLDPFMGSGTTAVVAERLGRTWVGYELNPAYRSIVERRLELQHKDESPKGGNAADDRRVADRLCARI